MRPILILILAVTFALVLHVIRKIGPTKATTGDTTTNPILQYESGPCAHPDYNGLVALYNSTNGPGWIHKTNWLDTCDVCMWNGVSCDVTNRVTHVILPRNGLSGPIPDEIGELEALQHLDLDNNNLTGSIPESIADIPLRFLLLKLNDLTGSIPGSFTRLAPTLEHLQISNNLLSGTFPSLLGDLTNLTVLTMENNQFTGAIDPGIGNLINLEIFYCGGMPLTSIPGTIGNMTSLEDLYLSWNQITSIPPEMGDLANIEQIYIEYNQLSGTIPNELGQLSTLKALALESNFLQGEIPMEFENLLNIEYLFMGSNSLSGFLPPGLGFLPLRTLEVWNNNLQGCIPASYSNLCTSGAQFHFESNPCLWQGTFSQFCGGASCSFTDYSLSSTAGTTICSGITTTLETSGGMVFSWSTGESSPSITIAPLQDTWYYITLTTLGGCTRMDSILVAINAAPAVSVSGTNVTTYGGNDGSATAIVSGGLSPYSYLWNTGASTPNITNLSAGIYTCTITDSHGCLDIDSILINQPSCQPSGTPCDDGDPNTFNDLEDGLCNCLGTPCPTILTGLKTFDVTCFGQDDGSAFVDPSGGIDPYIISWSNGDAGPMTGALVPGTYTVTITDAKSCAVTSAFTISAPPLLTSYVIGDDESMPGAADGSADVTVSGGTPPYTFLWSNGANNEDLTGLPGENSIYAVTITDFVGCQTLNMVTIQTDCFTAGTSCDDQDPNTYNDVEDGICHCIGTPCASINLNFLMANVSCFGASDGNARVIPVGGVQPYFISWSQGSTESQVDNLSPGSYGVTITDQTGCFVTRSFTIAEPEELSIELEANDETFAGSTDGAIDLSIYGGTYPYQVQWSNGEITQNLDNLTGNGMIYAVTISDTQGCQKSDSIQIFTGCLPKGTSCDDDNPETYDDQQNGNCTCVGIPCPEIELNVTKGKITCAGAQDGFIRLDPSGGQEPYTFTWSNGSESDHLSNLGGGIYFVTVTDAFGCREVSFFQVLDPDPIRIEASITPASSLLLADGSITLLISGGVPPYNVKWSDGSTEDFRQDLLPGQYMVDVFDQNSCVRRDTFVVGNQCSKVGKACDDGEQDTFEDQYDDHCNCIGKPCLSLDILPQITHVSCFGELSGAAYIDTTGLVISKIDWSTGESGNQISNLVAGSYKITISDVAGCVLEIPFEVLQPDLLVLEPYGGDETGPAAKNGYAAVAVSGGNPPYHIMWSTGASLPLIENLSGSQYYHVTVTDALGCTSIDSIYIAEFICAGLQEGAFIATVLPNLDCEQQAEVTIEVYSGQSGDYVFSLDGLTFQSSPTFKSPANGIYIPVVKDQANGCQYLLSQIEVGSLPDIGLEVRHPTSCNSSNGALVISNKEYQIGLSMDGPWYASEIPDLSSAEYMVFALANGGSCPWSLGSYQVGTEALDSSVLELIKSDVPCGEDFGRIEIVSISAEISFSIDRGNRWYSNPQFFAASPGYYEILIQTGDGCISVHSSFEVESINHLDIDSIIVNQPSDCEAKDGRVEIFGSNLEQFSIDTGRTWSSEPEFTQLGGGTYTIWARDADDLCLDSTKVILKAQDQNNPIFIEDKLDPSCHGTEDGYIRLGVANDDTNYIWQWNNGLLGPEQGRLKAGVYNVLVTKSPFCSQEVSLELIDPDAISIDLPAIDSTLYCRGGIIPVQLQDTTLAYTWYQDDKILANSNRLHIAEEGKYRLVGRDTNGCELSKVFEIVYSDQLFSANFLLSAIAIAGRPINAIEISWPVPDELSWKVEGGTVEGSYLNQSTLLFEQAGQYEVTLSAMKDGCLSVIKKLVTVQEDNGQWMFPSNQPEESIKLTLFPNPNLGNFNALIQLTEQSDIQIRIYNGDALLVYSAKFDSVEVLSHNIDLTGSIPGIYTLLVHSKSGLRTASFVIE